MRTDVYVGPSLARIDRHASAERLNFRPPIQHGDLFKSRYQRGDRVVILDGLYHHNAAIRHKEILHFLDRGVIIIGAASIGALRAADLHQFGMRGVGSVFEAYRDGVLTDDDEVAVAHGHAPDFTPLTVPLVEVREACRTALVQERTSRRAAAALLSNARSIPYGLRGWSTVIKASAARWAHYSADFDEIRQQHHPRHAVKSRDAKEAIAVALRSEEASTMPNTPRVDFVDRWEAESTLLQIASGNHKATDVLDIVRLFHPDWPSTYERIWAEHSGSQVDALAVEAGLATPDGLGSALAEMVVADPLLVPLQKQAAAAAEMVDSSSAEVRGALEALGKYQGATPTAPDPTVVLLLEDLWGMSTDDATSRFRQSRLRGFESPSSAARVLQRVVAAQVGTR